MDTESHCVCIHVCMYAIVQSITYCQLSQMLQLTLFTLLIHSRGYILVREMVRLIYLSISSIMFLGHSILFQSPFIWCISINTLAFVTFFCEEQMRDWKRWHAGFVSQTLIFHSQQLKGNTYFGKIPFLSQLKLLLLTSTPVQYNKKFQLKA